MKQPEEKQAPPRFSHLSRMLISQSSELWDFHVSWCRFVSQENDYHSDRPHRHSLCEMQLVTAGSLSLFTPAGEQLLLPGQWMLLPPGMLHHLSFHQPGSRKLVIGFSVKHPAPRIEAAMPACFMRLHSATGAMQALLQALQEKEQENLLLTPYIVSCLIQGLILEALNLHSPPSPEQEAERKHSLADERVDAACRYIQANIAYAVTVREVAGHVSIHPRHLNRLFHQACGQSVSQRIQQMRMEHARLLLESTDMSLSDIAESMNFSSVYAFSRTFKTVCGVPPGKFQRDAAAR